MLPFQPGRACTAVLVFAALASACGSLDDRTPQSADTATPKLQARIIATERGPHGGHLVFIAESGERMAALTESALVDARDNSPAWSPDGRNVLFASSRGRNSLVESSLWIVPATPSATPRRLTYGDAVDRDPVWTRDGRAVVFASNRDGSFDLWRVELAPTPYGFLETRGAPVKLTSAPGQELFPSIAPDGKRIAYMGVEADQGSRLYIWQDGKSLPISAGPADVTPQWSPDGKTIAFAAPSQRDKAEIPPRCPQASQDADLYLVDPDGKNRRLLAREPLADQTGPVWSPDGRFLFSTSIYRSVDSCKSLLSSITFIDISESPPVLRALHDPVGVEPRTGPAVNRRALDVSRLRRNQPYSEALRQAVMQELIRAEESARQGARDKAPARDGARDEAPADRENRPDAN